MTERNVELAKPARARLRPSWIVGGIVAALVLLLGTLRIVGLEPHGMWPGMWLKGELVTTPITDWSFAETDPDRLRDDAEGQPNVRGSGYPLVLLQTREHLFPLLAYSVTTSCVIMNGKLYVGAMYVAGVPYPEGRHWNKNLFADPRVRIKLGKKLYDRALLLVTDPVINRALLEEWDTRRPHASDPGQVKIWFEVVPQDDARLNAA